MEQNREDKKSAHWERFHRVKGIIVAGV